jgi:CRISPR/Cas system-associated endonuclease Cas1
VAGVDLAESSGLEVMFIHTSSGTLHYVAQNGTIVQFTDAQGDPIGANDDQGVA